MNQNIMNSVSKADRQEAIRSSNQKVTRKPPHKHNYETLANHSHLESKLSMKKRTLSKNTARSASKSASKALNTTVNGNDHTYTPLRASPDKSKSGSK